MASQQVGVYSNTRDPIPTVLIDVILSEAHSADNTVTELPLEDGSPLTDHVIIKPDTVEISVEVSNYDGANAKTTGERAKTAWQRFKQLRLERQLLTITTEHEIYENMVVASLSATHVIPFSGRMIYTCKFQRVDVTNLSIVAVPESILAGGPTEFKGIGPAVAKSAGSLIEAGVVGTISKDLNPELVQSVAQTILEKSLAVISGETTLDELLADGVSTLVEDGLELLPFDTSGSRNFLTNFAVGAARSLSFTSKYNYMTRQWGVDILDSLGNEIATGRQIVPGQDILAGLVDLKRDFGSILAVDMKPERYTEAFSSAISELGSSAASEMVVAAFAPGVWEDIETAHLIPKSLQPQTNIFDIGWTVK